MTDIVNLNRFRKAKARTQKEREAAESRVKHGRIKAERQREAAAHAARDRILDGSKINVSDEPSD